MHCSHLFSYSNNVFVGKDSYSYNLYKIKKLYPNKNIPSKLIFIQVMTLLTILRKPGKLFRLYSVTYFF